MICYAIELIVHHDHTGTGFPVTFAGITLRHLTITVTNCSTRASTITVITGTQNALMRFTASRASNTTWFVLSNSAAPSLANSIWCYSAFVTTAWFSYPECGIISCRIFRRGNSYVRVTISFYYHENHERHENSIGAIVVIHRLIFKTVATFWLGHFYYWLFAVYDHALVFHLCFFNDGSYCDPPFFADFDFGLFCWRARGCQAVIYA